MGDKDRLQTEEMAIVKRVETEPWLKEARGVFQGIARVSDGENRPLEVLIPRGDAPSAWIFLVRLHACRA